MSATAIAQPQPDLTVLNSHIYYKVQADGRHVVEKTSTVRIETPQAVQRFGQLALPYSSALQRLELLEAYALGRDGTRIDVPADRIVEQQSPQSAGAPMFDDGKVKTVIFPGVTPGTTLHLHTRLSQLKPLFPGNFSMVEHASGIFNVERETVTLEAPASLPLQVDAVAWPGGRIEAKQAGTQFWQWDLKDWKALPVELGSVAPQDSSPRLAVTTLRDHQAAADAYRSRALPQAGVTPAIQALADEITQGIAEKRAQAEAIYRWVTANIRYVAIFMDVGGVVPHAADEIAKARYGDCKDHSTVLSALLAAKGIASSPVLVNADLRYWRPTAVAAPGVFNHVILQLSGFGSEPIYLDSTAALAPFGSLPATLRGKPALVVGSAEGKASFVKLPHATPLTDRVRVMMSQQLSNDGSLSGRAEVSSEGLFGLFSRGLMNALPPGAEPQVAGRMLAMTGQNGSGSFTRGEPLELSRPHHYSTEFTLPGYAQLPGPGAFIVPMGLGSFSGIAATFEQLGLAQRSQPMPLFGRHVEEQITLQLPPGLKPSALPRGAKLEWAHGRYSSSVSAEGQTVKISRVLELAPPGPLLTPQDYLEFRSFGQAVLRDLRAQVLY